MADNSREASVGRSRAAAEATARHWAEAGHIVAIDSSPGHLWIVGELSAEQYFADAIEAAEEEARDEVRDLIDTSH